MTPAARFEVELDLRLRTGPPHPLTLTTRSWRGEDNVKFTICSPVFSASQSENEIAL